MQCEGRGQGSKACLILAILLGVFLVLLSAGLAPNRTTINTFAAANRAATGNVK